MLKSELTNAWTAETVGELIEILQNYNRARRIYMGEVNSFFKNYPDGIIIEPKDRRFIATNIHPAIAIDTEMKKLGLDEDGESKTDEQEREEELLELREHIRNYGILLGSANNDAKRMSEWGDALAARLEASNEVNRRLKMILQKYVIDNDDLSPDLRKKVRAEMGRRS